jgi:hypothetical protein
MGIEITNIHIGSLLEDFVAHPFLGRPKCGPVNSNIEWK